ncbi:MarR family winged helix-turn-helix transcriptional regulator [Taklimakanibacter deserti]|uniref:MarR family winged helix-turn-helix transcriptional regulator n=1 Tax=Taklimakanibacter deserti TaxID=2267839 RepID=UPI000E651D60
MSDDGRTGNLVGALVIALGDALRVDLETASGRGISACAALATALAYPGESVDALRRTLGLSAAGATRLVDGLQADKLVERRAELEDGRSRAVVLTDAGRKQAKAVLAARRAVLARALAPLSKRERGELARMLNVMLAALTPDRQTCDRICRLCDVSRCPQDNCPVELAALRAERA